MRRLVLAFLFLAVALPAKAKDIYIAQHGTGTGSGCRDALSSAWFSDATNWGPAPQQISSGTTVHLCGTFNGTPGQQMLTAQGSNVTILFEPGAKLSGPEWSAQGAINISNLSNVTVDGGGGGLIENTANGTGLAYRNSSVGVNAQYCSGCEVKNITIANLYVHTSVNDFGVTQTAVNCVYFRGADNFAITSVTCHDAGWAFAGNGNNFTIAHNEVYRVDHGVAVGAEANYSGFSIHDNHIHDFANWDTTANAYHHDGVHMWGQSGGAITNGTIYNNLFDGDSGVNSTGEIFLQDSIQNVSVYNNVFMVRADRVIVALWFEATSTSMPSGSAVGNSAHDNTISAGGHWQGSAMMADNQLKFTANNNIFVGGGSDISIRFGTTLSAMDRNVYVDLGPLGYRNTFRYQNKSYQTLGQWSSACGCDRNGKLLQTGELTLSSTGQLPPGSAAAGAGANLPVVIAGANANVPAGTAAGGPQLPIAPSPFPVTPLPVRPPRVAGFSFEVN